MISIGIPDIPSLAEATVELLRRGLTDSNSMREQLAARFQLGREDQAWRKFVNNHAWALVRLQAQGRIRKFAPGRYELALGEPDATLPIRASEPLPKWARVLVSAATVRNATRWQAEPFNKDDLIELWNEGGGRCMLTGLPFRKRRSEAVARAVHLPHRLIGSTRTSRIVGGIVAWYFRR